MNRLKEFFGDSGGNESPKDYFEIETRWDTFAVSRKTALEVECRLDQLPLPPWVVFRDLSGSRHRILAQGIGRISECTAAQRAATREFRRARRLEDKRDRRPWEENDD